MDLWSWAVSVYGREGVADAALALQDEHGQCVPLLLWAAFTRPVAPDLIDRAVSLARTWEAVAILPLRAARRGLKADLPGAPAEAREALRKATSVIGKTVTKGAINKKTASRKVSRLARRVNKMQAAEA